MSSPHVFGDGRAGGEGGAARLLGAGERDDLPRAADDPAGWALIGSDSYFGGWAGYCSIGRGQGARSESCEEMGAGRE
eukprot:5389359-Pleurochrysis_carterae.AAC.1